MIYHAFSDYTPSDPDSQRRHRIARMTWERQPWTELPIPDGAMPRVWRERDKAYPYLKDLFDFACMGKQEDDIIVFTNSDIQVRGDACVRIAEALQTADCAFSYRRDFHHRIETPIPDPDYTKGLDYPGSDLKAFRVFWWDGYKQYFPDMLIAAEAWDPTMRQLMTETNGVQIPNIICHERHGSYWENPVNRYTLKSQLHNLALAKAFFLKRGINPANIGIL